MFLEDLKISLVRQWNRWTNSPVGLMRAFTLIIFFGCVFHIFVFANNMRAEDYIEYDAEETFYERGRGTGLRELEKFQPKLFKASEISGHLMNLKNFSFSVNVPRPKAWCLPSFNKSRVMIIIVLSRVNNSESRSLIRSTWGSLLRIRKWNIKLVFMVSKMHSKLSRQVKSSLRNEITRYKDIIMGNFADEDLKQQRYLPHYEMMAFKWALTYCSNAEFVIRAIDTMFVDMFQVTEMINHVYPRGVLLCKANQNSKKLGLGRLVPDICAPSAMVLSMDVVEMFYLKSNKPFKNATQDDEQLRISWRKEKSRNQSLSQEYPTTFDFHPTNVAHKYLRVPEVAFDWVLNGQLTRDQKLPWTFVVLPKLDVRVKMWVKTLWTKTVFVNSLVFEFRLSPEAKIDTPIVHKIMENFKNVPYKLPN